MGEEKGAFGGARLSQSRFYPNMNEYQTAANSVKLNGRELIRRKTCVTSRRLTPQWWSDDRGVQVFTGNFCWTLGVFVLIYRGRALLRKADNIDVRIGLRVLDSMQLHSHRDIAIRTPAGAVACGRTIRFEYRNSYRCACEVRFSRNPL